MSDYVQISAQISEATRKRLDQYARETGLKKGRLIEDAIEAHLDTLDAVPAEYIVPNRLVVTAESWQHVLESIERPAEPTAELRALVRPDADAD